MSHCNLCVCLRRRVHTWVVTCMNSQKRQTPFVPLIYECLLRWEEALQHSARIINKKPSWYRSQKPLHRGRWVREGNWLSNIIWLYNSICFQVGPPLWSAVTFIHILHFPCPVSSSALSGWDPSWFSPPPQHLALHLHMINTPLCCLLMEEVHHDYSLLPC